MDRNDIMEFVKKKSAWSLCLRKGRNSTETR